MKSFKKLPMALTVMGLGAASALAEIKVTDNLALTGFLDMSAVYNDESEELTASFDQFEVDFLLNFEGGISARADINTFGNTGGAVFEQGYINYTTGPVGVTVGRFLSSSGFEAAEPTGLYQFSYSKTLVYGGYQTGLALSYGTEMFGLYGAVVTDVWDAADTDLETPGFEAQVSLMPMEGVTAKVAYLYQMYDEDVTGDASQQLLNAWAQYVTGPITVAAEYNFLMDWTPDATVPAVNDETGHGFLVMGNYKVTDKLGLTLRYSQLQFEDADADNEVTFSPGYAITDNWFALAEAKYELEAEVMTFAVESLFTF